MYSAADGICNVVAEIAEKKLVCALSMQAFIDNNPSYNVRFFIKKFKRTIHKTELTFDDLSKLAYPMKTSFNKCFLNYNMIAEQGQG